MLSARPCDQCRTPMIGSYQRSRLLKIYSTSSNVMSAHVQDHPATIDQTIRDLIQLFASGAIERDERGGTPKIERDAIRTSGLLALSIPRQYGGLGADWTETLDSVRSFARVDSSLAHVYGFHHLLLATVRLFARPDQWEPWFEQTARKHWFWGNALNPLDTRTVAKKFDNWYEFSGKKSFCSGAIDSEMLIASGIGEPGGRLLLAAIPTSRSGITLHHDWNSFGQRQTDSGSALFERVRVEESELLLDPGPLSTPFSCLRPLLAQLIFAHMFLGIGEGVFAEMKRYTLHESRPWFRSPAERASKDPHTLRHYGEYLIGLESVRLLLRQATTQFDEAWDRGATLDAHSRGRLAIAIAAAKVAATRANGAGKTTTLKAMSNLLGAERGTVSRGRVLLRGEPADRMSASDLVKRGVVQVLEGRRCFAQLTVEENLLSGGFLRGPSRQKLKAELEQVYVWFPRLRDKRGTQAGLTSGGEQQMVAIGRALMTHPSLVLLDEPSMGLAPVIVQEIFEIIDALRSEQQISFLIAEQNANLALRYADYGYILENGVVAASGTSTELRLRDDVTDFYLGKKAVAAVA